MPCSNAFKYDPALYHFTLICRALGHPARVSIVHRLIASESWCGFRELGDGLPLAKQTLSNHLKILREMSLIQCTERKGKSYFRLNPDLLNSVTVLFSIATQAKLKHDAGFQSEISVLNARERIGRKM